MASILEVQQIRRGLGLTRECVVGLLRKWLIKAKDSLKLIEKGKKALEEIEPEIRMLFPIVKGEEILRVHVHKIDDIAGLIMLRREFKLKTTTDPSMHSLIRPSLNTSTGGTLSTS